MPLNPCPDSSDLAIDKMISETRTTDAGIELNQVDNVNSKPGQHHIEAIDPNAARAKEAQLPAIFGKDSVDAEVAQYLDSSVVIDAELNRQIKRKIDKRILPLIILAYFCQTFDKGTLAFASIIGLQTDTHLVGNQYALLGTILYIGYMIGEFPVNRIIQRVPLAKFLGILVCLWGSIVCLHAACNSFSSLMAVRFFLGMFESGVQPCLMTITVMYYRREEHPTIISYWYCQQGVQLMVAGLIAYGFTYLQNSPIYPWQALFLVVGGFTICVGVAILVFLPDSPMRAKCWDAETKTLIIERLRVNELGVQEHRFKMPQFFEALKDPVVWLYFLLQLSCFIITGGLAVFANIIVNGLGFTVRQTQLLNLAQGSWSILIFIGSAWLARTTNQTIIVMISFMAVALAGTVVLDTVPVNSSTAPGLLVAFYLANCVITSGNLIFSLVTRNIAGQSKKVTTLTLMFVAYALGNIIGPQVFQSTDAPKYHNAFAVHLALYALFIVMAVVLRIVLMRRNAHRRKIYNQAGVNPAAEPTEEIAHDLAFADLTDLKNEKAFRYMY